MQINYKVKMYYLYQHIRKDTNEVFYVGIGTLSNKKNKYSRAYNKCNRSEFWKKIITKYGYNIEIVLESNDRDFICQKEIEYISKYGRRDLGTGPLVNFTTGGDANYNVSKERINLRIENNKEKIPNKELSEKRRLRMLGNKLALNVDNKISKEVFVYYANTGEYYRSYKSITICHKELIKSKCPTRLKLVLKDHGTYKGFMFFYEYKGKTINPKEIKVSKKKKKVICLNDNMVFESIRDAAKHINGCASAIRNSIVNDKNYKNYKFKFI